MAKALAESSLVDEMWLLVSPQNPFKANANLLDDETRLRLTRLAVSDVPGVEVCDREFSLPRPSYMFNTLTALSREHPDREFVLVIGADNLVGFPHWREHDAILREFGIAVFPRKGWHRGHLKARLMKEDPTYRIALIDMPLVTVSSTEIREALASGRDASLWLM